MQCAFCGSDVKEGFSTCASCGAMYKKIPSQAVSIFGLLALVFGGIGIALMEKSVLGGFVCLGIAALSGFLSKKIGDSTEAKWYRRA